MYVDRGRAWQAKGNMEAAMGDFDRALRANPDHAEAYTQRARAHETLKQDAEALADYEKAHELGDTSEAVTAKLKAAGKIE